MSLGVASIISMLRAREVAFTARSVNVADDPAVVQEQLDATADHLLTVANDASADVWIGAFVWNEPHVQQLIKQLRTANFLGRIGVAGPQVS